MKRTPIFKITMSISILFIHLMVGCAKETLSETDGEDDKPVPPPVETISHPRLMYNAQQIDFVKAKIAAGQEPWAAAYRQLIRKADGFANRTHVAVSTFHVPPFYNDPDASGDAKDGYMTDAHAAYTNALAFVLSGNSTYATKAIYFLNAWASINTTISTTGDTPLVSSYGGTGFLIAADLLMNSAFWTTPQKETFKNWVRLRYLPVVAAIKGNSNNWGDWATFAVISSYGVLGDQPRLLQEVDRIKSRINVHIAADGHMPQEVRRAENGIWYTYFALSGMTSAARVAQNAAGQNLFNYTSPNGRTIKSALDYLHFYLKNQQAWPWHTMGPRNLNNLVWPVDLFEAMNDFYGNTYNELVTPFRPVLGGYKNDFVKATHVSWNYPTLMRMP